MNALVVLAACVCAGSAQVLYGPARAINPAPSHQFHAQDEFGQFSFGYAGGPSARTESRNAYGVTTGSWQYVDSNGLLQTVNYIADPVNGFRVAGTNLPVGPAVPAAPEVAPLVAPVFNLPLPVAPSDTPEVAAAKEAHFAAVAAAAAAPSERKKRQAVLPYPALAGLQQGVYAAAPANIVANISPATPVVAASAALPLGYAGLPLNYAGALPYAGAHPYAGALPYAGAYPFAGAHPYAGAFPLAAAAPAPASREATLTTIKANPGHAIVYTVA